MEQNKEYTLARLILRLANRIVKNRDRHVKELGLTTEQADSLLFFLDRKDAVINDLKDHLGVTHQTARGIVQRMESKGLVQTRNASPRRMAVTRWCPPRRRAGAPDRSCCATASRLAAACSMA